MLWNFLFLSFFLSTCFGLTIVPQGWHAVYHYKSQVKTAVIKPTGHGSFWQIEGKLHIHGGPDEQLIFQMWDSKIGVYSGEIVSKEMKLPGPLVPVSKEIDEILQTPWKVQYRNGIATEVDLGAGVREVQFDNIKRSIASLIQLDYRDSLNVWISKENNLFGTCEATYTTSPTNNNEIHIRKFVDHSTCLNQPTKSFTFDRVFPCASKKIESSSSQRLFVLEPSKQKTGLLQLNYLEGNGSNLFLPFLKYGNSKYVFVSQKLQLENLESDPKTNVTFVPGNTTSLKFEIGPRKSEPINLVVELLEKIAGTLSINVENHPEIDFISPLNTVILKRWLSAYNKDQIIEVYQQISDKNVLKIILDNIVPTIGTQASLEYVIHLFTNDTGTRKLNYQMLSTVVFSLIDPKEEDFLLFEKFMENTHFSQELERKKILAGSALLGRVCESQCRPDLLTKYITSYLRVLDVSECYMQQLVHISALNNLASSNLIGLLGPIIRSHPDDFIRYHAIFAISNLASSHPKEIEALFWPIFINRTEPIELRIEALNLLLISEPTAGRIIHLHWFIDSQKDPQLYHFYYSLIETYKDRHHPCLKKTIQAIQHVSCFLKTPPSTHWGTSFSSTEYSDEELGIGTSTQMITVAASNKIWPTIIRWKTEEWARGHYLNDIEISFRAEGIVDKILKNNPKPTPEYIIESLKKLNLNLNKKESHEHIELVIKKNQRIYDVVYTSELSEIILSIIKEIKTTFFKKPGLSIANDFLIWLDSFQTITPSDMGTEIVESYESNFFLSMKYNGIGQMDNNSIEMYSSFLENRYSRLSVDMIVNSNPFINSKDVVFNKFEQKIHFPVFFTIKSWTDALTSQEVFDLIFKNTKDVRISYLWETNSTTLVTLPAAEVMKTSCPECKHISNVPPPHKFDIDNTDVVFEVESLGLSITLKGETIDWAESELFNQIWDSIFANSRVLGFIGSPTHLLNYIIDHYTIVHLAENSILQVDLEVRNDSEMILSLRVPSDESINNINNFTLSFDSHLIGQEDGNIFFIRGSVDCGNEFINIELESRIEEEFERCVRIKLFSPLESPSVLEVVYAHNCSQVNDSIAEVKISDNWTVDQKDADWPVEMFETLPELEDWYNEVNDFDKACKEAWRNQSYNVTLSIQPYLEDDVIVEFQENDVKFHDSNNMNSVLSTSIEHSSKNIYDLVYFDNDLFGLSSQCVLNMHDIITWDRFQRKWLNHSDNCYSLVAAETTESPQFVIWAKQLDPSKPLLKLKMYADGNFLEIVPKENGLFEVFNITETDQRESIPIQGIYDSIELIHRNGQLIIYTDEIDLLTNGKFVYLSGNYMIWNQLAGLCGSYDGDPFNDINIGLYEDCSS